MTTEGTMTRTEQAATWLRTNASALIEAAVMAPVALFALAGSADHALALGRENGVTGWHSWTVAGSLEILAAYAAWQFRCRQGRERILPAAAFAVTFGLMLAINWAAAGAEATLWRRVYFLTPPAVFIAAALLGETRRWVARRQVKRPPTRVVTPVKAAPSKVTPPKASAAAVPPKAPPAPSPPPPGGGGSTPTTRDRVMAHLLQEGPAGKAELARALDANPETVKSALEKLARDGRIVQPVPRGPWQPADHERLRAVR